MLFLHSRKKMCNSFLLIIYCVWIWYTDFSFLWQVYILLIIFPFTFFPNVDDAGNLWSVWSDHPEWAVLSRTVQPENAWVLVNLRFVSPWKTVSLKPTRMNQWSSKPPKCRSHHSQSDSKITVLLCMACIVSVIFSDVICSFIELTDHSVLWHCQNYFIITCNFTDSQDVIFFNIKNKKQKKNNELINVFKTSSKKKKMLVWKLTYPSQCLRRLRPCAILCVCRYCTCSHLLWIMSYFTVCQPTPKPMCRSSSHTLFS